MRDEAPQAKNLVKLPGDTLRTYSIVIIIKAIPGICYISPIHPPRGGHVGAPKIEFAAAVSGRKRCKYVELPTRRYHEFTV